MTANGLRPYPAYRESGVEWLSKVPEHWEVRAIKTLFREKDDRSRGGGETLLSFTRQHGILPHSEVAKRPVSATDLSRYRLCKTDDLVMNRMQAWSGMLAVTPIPGLVSPDYSVFTPRKASEVHVDFFERLFRTPFLVDQFARRSRGIGSGFNRLYTPDFGAVPAVSPPLAEQRAIARFLDAVDRRIRRYIRAKERLIELLEERKRALIHEAVTGRIDVRTGQPYPAYRDSGVQWLGEVPKHWEVRRLKTLSHMQSGEAITAMSINATGDCRVFGGNGLRGYTSDYTHDGEYVLIGRQGALCGNIHLARGRFWASEHAVVATLAPAHVLEWFGALLEVMDLNQYSIAAAQPGLSVDRVLNLWAPVPPADEQVLMSEDLVERSREMEDALVTAKRQIALLKEHRTRLIADVVTGKLDVREAAARLPGTDPRAGDRDRADTIRTESNLHSTAQDMMKEASA